MPKKSCRTELSRKIAINMAEYKEGRYKSPAQAIAVAYSQVQKKRPACKKSLKKKSKKSMKKKSMKKSKKAKTKKRKSAGRRRL
jgi:hypothetical protein